MLLNAGGAARSLIFLGLLAGCAYGQTAESGAADWWGKPVLERHLECDCHLKLPDFADALTQQVGQPLDPAKISESLKRLYATGQFVELRADVAPQAGGVLVIFVARAQYFVGLVTVRGAPGPVDSRALITASRLRLGQRFDQEALERAQQRMNDLLMANGYYQSRIVPHVERNPDTLEADVAFTIAPRPPARVSAVQFPPGAGFDPQRLKRVSGLHPRMYLTAARLQRALDHLRQFYISRGRLQATISATDRKYDSKSNTESVTVKIVAGPLFEVRVKGASISNAQLQQLLPLYRDGVADDQALERCDKALEAHFQQKGYFSAAVTANRQEQGTPPAKITILFQAELGARGDFAGYGVRGNSAIPRSRLTAAIASSAQGILLPRAPTFSADLVEQKTAALVALYHAEGFLQVRVTPAINDNYQDVSRRRFVTFEITEGPRTTVESVSITGLDAPIQNKIWPLLMLKQATPFSAERALADRDHILDYLGDNGYTQARVEWQMTPADHLDRVDVRFAVTPGPQQRIRHVVLLGNEHARAGLVNRQLLFRDGEPVSQSALAESQRKLYNLGIFNQIQITPQEVPVSNTDKTMLVGMEESRRWSLGYGIGFEVQRLGSNTPQGTFKASPRGSLSLTRLDVGGRGQTFSMGGRLSYIDTGADAGYLIPRLLNRDDLDLRIKALVDRSREVLTFTENLQEITTSVEKRFPGTALLIGQYAFRRVEALDISSRVSAAEVPLLSQPAIVGMMEGTFINDRRDDPLDATRGSYTLANGGIAWTGFASQSDFGRFNGKNSTYYTLTPHLVLARLTQFGLVSHFGGLYNITVPANDGHPAQTLATNEIPLPERFFMGGSQSMRGFSINQAGPRDPQTGYPLGGDALFLNSVELRTFFAQRRLGVVLFEDAGNVYTGISRMRLFKVTQSSPEDFDYTAHAVGVGFRFKTPVGPLSLDAGYNLNPPRFNVVNTVNGVPTTQIERLSNFQFFLSFGQSF